MSYTKQQRMINQAMGYNKFSNNKQIDKGEERTAIGTGMYIPNHSGVTHHPEFKALPLSINFFISGGGAEIADGIAGCLRVPFKCTITGCTLLADQTGSIKIDIWKDNYTNYPPTDADTITGANEPEIAAGVKDEDTTLTSWNTAIEEDDILYFNVDSCTTIQWCLIALKITRED